MLDHSLSIFPAATTALDTDTSDDAQEHVGGILDDERSARTNTEDYTKHDAAGGEVAIHSKPTCQDDNHKDSRLMTEI